MSNLRNRFLALAIVVMMLVAALSSTASAATTKFVDVDDPDDAKMISLLSAIGIVKGAYADEDGSMVFDSETPVSRQQMALFLARINSANPGAFEPDDSIKLTFTDVKDSTYFLAIKHCYEQGIIEGRDAETFDPLNTVKLDEALAMIVRALGFKDLSYPIETTKKAKELGFALKYADTAGKNELTRIEVMRLLYTYFYSDEQSLEIVKNEITGVQHTVRVPHPVMEKFGISVNESYIVRSNDYTAVLANATLETPNGDTLTLPAVTVPNLTTSDINAGRTVILAYNNYKVVSTSNADPAYLNSDTNKYTRVNGYAYSGKWSYIAVRPEDIDGLEEDYSDRWAVGLKVVYYQDTLAATRSEALGVLSYVKGSKISLADVDVKEYPTTTNMRDDLDDFSDYSKGVTLFGNEYDLRQNAAQESALTNAEIYQFRNGETKLTAGTVSATSDKIGDIRAIAKNIKMNGQFGLEYVVNDTDENGVATEFYYVYTPYSVGYYKQQKTPDDSNDQDKKDIAYYMFVDGNGNDGNTKDWYYQHPDPSKNIVPSYQTKDVTKLETTNAYLYTREGKYLNIFAKLEKRVDSKYPEYVLSETIGLSGIAITVKSKNNSIAVGASTSTGSFKVGSKHSAFSLTATSDIFFVVRVEDKIDETSNRKYGVLTSTPTGSPYYLGTGSYLYMYSVFTHADNRTIDMSSQYLVSQYDYYTSTKLEAGDLVSYQKVGDYYRIGAFDNNTDLWMSGNGNEAGIKDYLWYDVVAGAYTHTANSVTNGTFRANTVGTYITAGATSGDGYSLAGNANAKALINGASASSSAALVPSANSTASSNSQLRTSLFSKNISVNYTASQRVLTVNGRAGIITSDTEILLTEYNNNTLKPEDLVATRKISNTDLETLINLGASYTIQMITTSGSATSNALVVHVKTQTSYSYNTDIYATVYELLGTDGNATGAQVSNVAKAYNYANGQNYSIATASGSQTLQKGQVVRISTGKYTTINGTQYTVAELLSSLYDTHNDAVDAVSTKGQYTQPINVKSSLETVFGRSYSTLGDLLDTLSGLKAYPMSYFEKNVVAYSTAGEGTTTYTLTTGVTDAVYSRTAYNAVVEGAPDITFYSIDSTKLDLAKGKDVALTDDSSGANIFGTYSTQYKWSTSTVQTALKTSTAVDSDGNATKISETYAEQIDKFKTNTNFTELGSNSGVYVDRTTGSAAAAGLIANNNYYNKTTTASATGYDAYSQLNKTKFNYIEITVTSGVTSRATALSASITSFNMEKGWEDIGGKIYGNKFYDSDLYDYYVITNNQKIGLYSDVITIIKVIR